MSGGRFRTVFLVGLAAGLVAALRALRGGPAPVFDGHPSVTHHESDPAAARQAMAATAAAQPTPPPDTAAPDAPGAPDEPHDAPTPEPQPEAPTVARSLQVEAIAADGTTAFTVLDGPASSTPEAATWVAPIDGTCPPSHPIKGKLKSGIYHQPGGLAYERTRPDRCYRTPADAEADGLRAAKR